MQIIEKVVYADFLHVKERDEVAPGKLSIPLGESSRAPDLHKLYEGEQVTLLEPGSFYASGRIHIVERNGSRWYYGVLDEEPQEDRGEHSVRFYA